MRTFSQEDQQLIDALSNEREQQKSIPKKQFISWFLSQPIEVRNYLNKQALVADCYSTANYWFDSKNAVHWSEAQAKDYAYQWLNKCIEHLEILKAMPKPKYQLP